MDSRGSCLPVLVLVLLAPLPLPGSALDPYSNDAGSGTDAGDEPSTALAIEPGTYRGNLTNGIDPLDHYAFDVPLHGGIAVGPGPEFLSTPPDLTLLAPDGAQFDARQTPGLLAQVAGTWILRVGNVSYPMLGIGRYAFTLDVAPLPAQDDAQGGRDAGASVGEAVTLSPGIWSAELNQFDNVDVFRATVPDGRLGTLQVVSPVGGIVVDVEVEEQVDGGEDPDAGGNATTKAFTFFGFEDREFAVTVTRAHGSGPYVVALLLDGGFDGSQLAGFTTVVDDLGGVGALSPRPGPGIDMANDDGLWLVTPERATLVRDDVQGPIVRDGTGILYAYKDERIVQLMEAEEVPVAPADFPPPYLLFGPEGRLYRENPQILEMPGDGAVSRIACDRSEEIVRGFDEHINAAAFAPDGTMYVMTREADLQGQVIGTLDTETGVFTPRVRFGWDHIGGLSFDGAGLGYAYNEDRDVLYGFDPETGLVTTIARGEDMNNVNLAVDDGVVYAASSGPFLGLPLAGYFDVEAPEFGGFRSACDLPPLADLVVTDVQVGQHPGVVQGGHGALVTVLADREVRVKVTNQGPGPVTRPFKVGLSGKCGGVVHADVCAPVSQRYNATLVNARLEPGESISVKLFYGAWTTTAEHELSVFVDWHRAVPEQGNVPELDDENNGVLVNASANVWVPWVHGILP